MKKILAFILIVIGFTITAQAQRATAQVAKSGTLSSISYYQTYTGLATDTISNNRQTWSYTLSLNKDTRCFYDIAVHLDEKAGTAKDSVYLLGRIHSSDSWTPIDTVIYAGVGTDTTIKFTQHSTATFYRDLKLYIGTTTASQRAQVYDIRWRVVK